MINRSHLAIASVALVAMACDPQKALKVQDVDVVTPSSLNSKSSLPTILATTTSQFQIAFSGGGDGRFGR